MNFVIKLLLARVLGWLGFVTLSWCFDFVVLSTPVINSHDILRAISDNGAHGVLAMYVWMLSIGQPSRMEDWGWILTRVTKRP